MLFRMFANGRLGSIDRCVLVPREFNDWSTSFRRSTTAFSRCLFVERRAESISSVIAVPNTSLVSYEHVRSMFSPSCSQGEHIDYCGYSVLPMAIDQDIVCVFGTNDTDEIEISNVDSSYAYDTIDGCRHRRATSRSC
jgi:hypothetical protein